MRLARRMQFLGTETAFEVLAQARDLERQGRDIVHMEIGEPDCETPEHVTEAAAQALRDGYEVSGAGFANAMRLTTENAYAAVPNPREGTMLTVFRECADAAERAVEHADDLR